MDKVEGSKRLKKISEHVKKGEPILDIGSDHAYLPIYLVKEKLVPKAIAGELVKGPFQKAKHEVIKHDLEEKIDVRFGDGFNVLKKEEIMGSIFICGMGGLLISEIIEKGNQEGKIDGNSHLILQANNKEKELRTLLMTLNFEILDESIVEEKHKFYEIIVAKKTNQKINYNQRQLTFGPLLLKKSSKDFRKKWTDILKKNQKILKKLNNNKHKNKITNLKKMNQEIEKVVE